LAQGRLTEALEAHESARAAFEALGEPAAVATAWHEIARVQKTAGHPDAAEAAYLKSLAIEVQRGNQSGEGITLLELAILYADTNRVEEAVGLSRQATDRFRRIGDGFREAKALNNLAWHLCRLGRLDEAREPARRAMELKKRYGDAAEPWTTAGILFRIEREAGRLGDAEAARAEAIRLYSAYRRGGGEPESPLARVISAVGHLLQEGDVARARSLIRAPEVLRPQLLSVRNALVAIVEGSRDPALAADPNLDYDDAVELTLLLESLARP
jgi:tetratricopeptide (TPR) repeat protein